MTDIEQIQYNAGKKVIEELNKMHYPVAEIDSSYKKNKKLRDGTIKDVVIISLRDGTMGRYYFVYVDAITLDLLYVMGPHKYIEISEFFKTHKNE